jgi:ABC-2 type transport system ATP-binding protein
MVSDVIIAEELTRFYGKLCAVDNVSFTVRQGEFFGLLGPNGAGKTTTIKMLTTVLRPTKGRATICGFDPTTHAHEVRKRIAVVQQRTALDMFLSVQDNLEIYAKLHDVPRAEIKKRLNWVLEQFDLVDHRRKAISELSIGLMRRVQVGRIFMCEPEIMFLDEPTSSLDPASRRKTWSIIKSIAKENKITIFLTSQSMEEAEKLCERVAIMDHGRILAIDTQSNLKKTLGGNSVIEIKTQIVDQKIIEGLKSLEEVEETYFSNDKLFVTVREANKALPKIVEYLLLNRIGILSIDLHEPSLEDVFLKLTGRKIGG